MKKPLKDGLDYYINENGYYVFTAHYHLERGYCCGNGCIHCPYDYEKADPSKQDFFRQRQKDYEKNK